MNGLGVQTKSLADTGANGYLVINKPFAIRLSKALQSPIWKLPYSVPIRGFQRKIQGHISEYIRLKSQGAALPTVDPSDPDEFDRLVASVHLQCMQTKSQQPRKTAPSGTQRQKPSGTTNTASTTTQSSGGWFGFGKKSKQPDVESGARTTAWRYATLQLAVPSCQRTKHASETSSNSVGVCNEVL
ncbi:hypothetical protein VC83_01381 [Pseudogymnoascus destructans]|uniref:Uncharacterized protein n=1 Tax=Pseudogymnoascus destructans TaxID=655981 RepID=A0A177AKB9_9PEZI|nr:uncharacterized protein VC83_01381 [Pseudogymnoascus destructans]OAF61733.1 hypothetical protein VC83_01381 [Pseudogymnoascus destructans]